MAKIKITESQLKMIAKHKALNESFMKPESNSKYYTMVWILKGPTQVRYIEAPDPIVAYKKFMVDVRGLLRWKTIDDLEWDDIKLDEDNGFKTVRESDLHGVVFYFDGFLSHDAINDILDIVKKGAPGYRSNKKDKALNELLGAPEEDTYKHKNGLFNWRDDEDEDDYVRTEVFEEIERLVRKGKIDEDDAYALMYEYDANGGGSEAYDYDTDQDNTPISNFDTNELLQNLMQRATPHLLNNKDMEEEEPIDYTMGNDDENQLPNPPSEISLNEGQLLLKKVFNQFK